MNIWPISKSVTVVVLAASLAGCSAGGGPEGDPAEEVRTGGTGGAGDAPGTSGDLTGVGGGSSAGGSASGGCEPGATRSCYEGPPGTEGVGACVAGVATCGGSTEFGAWGPCIGAVYPAEEVCSSGIDEDCNDEVDEACVVEVPVDIDGDCVTASCPPEAPHPIGCAITMDGNDSRGCVANGPGSPDVYFQEGDKCGVGHVGGTLSCSSQQGAALSEMNCTINKSDKFYPTSPSGCP